MGLAKDGAHVRRGAKHATGRQPHAASIFAITEVATSLTMH